MCSLGGGGGVVSCILRVHSDCCQFITPPIGVTETGSECAYNMCPCPRTPRLEVERKRNRHLK